MMRDVCVVEDVWGPAFEELSSRRTVHRAPAAWADPGQLQESVARSRALVVRNRTQVTRSLLEASPELRVVARAGVGLDNVDLQAADDLGLVVVAPLGVNATSVAEHALGLTLAVARKVRYLDAQVRSGVWERRSGRELTGHTWGLLSAGATARATARLARALGMIVVAHDPYVDPSDPGLAELGVSLLPIADVLAQADVLSVHLPATPQTRHLVDADFLAAMRKGAILVNVGRGEAVDEEALADALTTRHLSGAGLDVRDPEPPAVDSRLHDLENVVLTPHVAGITEQSQKRVGEVLCSNLDLVLSGEDATHAVGRHSRPSAGAMR